MCKSILTPTTRALFIALARELLLLLQQVSAVPSHSSTSSAIMVLSTVCPSSHSSLKLPLKSLASSTQKLYHVRTRSRQTESSTDIPEPPTVLARSVRKPALHPSSMTISVSWTASPGRLSAIRILVSSCSRSCSKSLCTASSRSESLQLLKSRPNKMRQILRQELTLTMTAESQKMVR